MKNLKKIKKRYLKVMESDGISKKDLHNIEKSLSIILPNDFKDISTYFSGGYIGSVDMYDFVGSDINIISETLRLRNAIQLPNNYVVIAEPPESLIVMDTEKSPAIIWCNSNDAENIKSSQYSIKPDKWENYSDFFNDMVTDMLDYM